MLPCTVSLNKALLIFMMTDDADFSQTSVTLIDREDYQSPILLGPEQVDPKVISYNFPLRFTRYESDAQNIRSLIHSY